MAHPSTSNSYHSMSPKADYLRSSNKVLAWALLLFSSVCLSLITSAPAQAMAETEGTAAYVTENIGIVMRSGPTNKYRVIGRAIAGDKITVLAVDDENQSSQIIDAQGKTGWISSEYIVETKSAKFLLQDSTNSISQLNQQLEDAKQQVLDKNGIIELNDQLQQQVSELTSEVETLKQQADLQKDRFRNDMFFAGGLTILVGMLIAWLITRSVYQRQKRSGWR